MHAPGRRGAARATFARRPDGTAKWNTDPPTSGPHFGFNPNGSVHVIWGAYEEPVQLARVIHNLEHGGVYIFYGDEVPDATVAQLEEFYDAHQTRHGPRAATRSWVTRSHWAPG